MEVATEEIAEATAVKTVEAIRTATATAAAMAVVEEATTTIKVDTARMVAPVHLRRHKLRLQ